MQAHNISSVVVVPSARLVDIVPACGVHTCNSCICAWRAPNTVWCSSANCWRASSVVMSLTVSPMSCRSLSVRVIRSKEVFEAFDFFCGPTCSLGRCHFNIVDVFYGFVPPSSGSVSCLGEGNFWPSRSFSTAFYRSFVSFAASCASYALAAAALCFLFSANCTIRSLALSFFFCGLLCFHCGVG